MYKKFFIKKKKAKLIVRIIFSKTCVCVYTYSICIGNCLGLSKFRGHHLVMQRTKKIFFKLKNWI